MLETYVIISLDYLFRYCQCQRRFQYLIRYKEHAYRLLDCDYRVKLCRLESVCMSNIQFKVSIWNQSKVDIETHTCISAFIMLKVLYTPQHNSGGVLQCSLGARLSDRPCVCCIYIRIFFFASKLGVKLDKLQSNFIRLLMLGIACLELLVGKFHTS